MALASLSSSTSCCWLNLIGPSHNIRGGGRAEVPPSTSRNSSQEIPQGICSFAANWVALIEEGGRMRSSRYREGEWFPQCVCTYNKINNAMTQFGSISLYFCLNFYANWIVKTINTTTTRATANNMALSDHLHLNWKCSHLFFSARIGLDSVHFPNANLTCKLAKKLNSGFHNRKYKRKLQPKYNKLFNAVHVF